MTPEPRGPEPPSTTAATAGRLLVVEDDVHLADALSRYLARAGYEVLVAHDGQAALRTFESQPVDLVVLDLMLPQVDGWDVCRRVRSASRVPIIMLTARSAESERVLGLKIGADDYVVKPFSLRELQARIEAVLRRVGVTRDVMGRIVYDDGFLRLEGDGLQVLRSGVTVPLTATERRLLFALAQSPGRVHSVRSLLQAVWGPGYVGQDNYVKLYVWRLRQKIEPDPHAPTYIRTERGLGYRFHCRPPTEP